jgi:acyl-CoA thioester hydrolase
MPCVNIFPGIGDRVITVNLSMKNYEPPATGVYQHHFTVPESAVDQNGHVNNVVYVQWMQDVAVLHYEAAGGNQAMQDAGATWVARSHHIVYLKPVFAGEDVIALTWVETLRRVRSLRCYQFRRQSDNVLLAKGETDWVFVDIASGRPRAIADDIISNWQHE